MHIPVITHVGLTCADPTATERFYTRHFGFQRARELVSDGRRIVFLKAGDFYLELFPAAGEAPEPPATKDGPSHPGFRHLAFRVADLDAALETIGPEAEITLGPLSLDAVVAGWRVAWIRDPDGRIVELSQGYRDQ